MCPEGPLLQSLHQIRVPAGSRDLQEAPTHFVIKMWQISVEALNHLHIQEIIESL